MKILFPSSFYTQYKAPNAEELIEVINSYEDKLVNNSKFKWGQMCSSDKIPLKFESFQSLLQPSIDLFADDLGLTFNYTLYNPWINLYKKGDFQEIHDHISQDFACVFFANDGENFAQFYFSDRNTTALTRGAKTLLKYQNNYPLKFDVGDIIFFPSHVLHGVTPHRSDTIRKTLAFNFDVDHYYKP